MFEVLCYGDSNTWGADPATSTGSVGRTLAGVLQKALGAGYHVIEKVSADGPPSGKTHRRA